MRDIKFRILHKDGTWSFFRFPLILYTTIIEQKKFDLDTVGQYTGLKDKNGVDIYEGDIVDYKGDNCIVEYVEDMFHLKSTKYPNLTDGNYRLASLHDLHKVIGNIHENPEICG